VPPPSDTGLCVPFLDLRPSNEPLKAELLDALAGLIDTNAYVNGPEVARFEAAFAGYCGTARSVGVSSGLDGLRLALLACDPEPGAEAIVPAMTFVATIEAVTQAGLRPVLVDISERDLCLDPDGVGAALSARMRFAVPVHLYGQLADMTRLAHIARRHDLVVIEDACQAHGAVRDGLRAGAAGDAAAFSFYPGKNLGAMGDAGAVTTSDHGLADRVCALREHGQVGKYRHEVEGYTARLDTMQALVLLHKLERLERWNEERRNAAGLYLEELAGVGDLELPPVPPGSYPVWHLFVIRTSERDALQESLARRGIATGRHYPDAVHRTRAYAHLGLPAGAHPVAERLAATALSLPLFPGISDEQLSYVVASIREHFDG
jgi:dTDP-4-amino-4,6-dideoxygalactose transaminase